MIMDFREKIVEIVNRKRNNKINFDEFYRCLSEVLPPESKKLLYESAKKRLSKSYAEIVNSKNEEAIRAYWEISGSISRHLK